MEVVHPSPEEDTPSKGVVVVEAGSSKKKKKKEKSPAKSSTQGTPVAKSPESRGSPPQPMDQAYLTQLAAQTASPHALSSKAERTTGAQITALQLKTSSNLEELAKSARDLVSISKLLGTDYGDDGSQLIERSEEVAKITQVIIDAKSHSDTLSSAVLAAKSAFDDARRRLPKADSTWYLPRRSKIGRVRKICREIQQAAAMLSTAAKTVEQEKNKSEQSNQQVSAVQAELIRTKKEAEVAQRNAAEAQNEVQRLAHILHAREKERDHYGLSNRGKESDEIFRLGERYFFGHSVPQSFELAFQQYRAAADAGHHVAMVSLASMYRLGQGVEKSLEDALKWYKSGATKGNKYAYLCLGEMQEKGEGMPGGVADLSKAFGNYVQAVELGVVEAASSVAHMYEYGKGTAKNLSLAIQWYRHGAELGHSTAQNNLGRLYYDGLVGSAGPDYSKAVHWFKLAAAQGNPNSLNNMGICYEMGRGVETADELEAIKCYRAAADLGHIEASCNYGYLLLLRNEAEEAAKRLRRAADGGSAAAMFHLGAMYEAGLGVSRDLRASFEYYGEASSKGYVEAQRRVGIMLLEGKGCTIDEFAAYNALKEAADNGDGEAMYRIGVMCELGVGTVKDIRSAEDLYHKSAEARCAAAFRALASLYERHPGLNPDLDNSLNLVKTLYMKAAEKGDEKAKERLRALAPSRVYTNSGARGSYAGIAGAAAALRSF